MRRRSKTALLAAGMALAAASAQAAELGINIPNGAASGSLIGSAAATHAHYARAFMIWDGDSLPSQATVSAWDGIVSGWNAAGIEGVIVVTGHGRPPASVADFASYIGYFAARYGSRVAGWEVWNEPDERAFWGAAGGDPDRYAQLLRASYPRVHPFAPVFVGGLTGNNADFLSKVYAAGGGGSFDGVAVHTDTACSIVGPDQFYRDPGGAVARFSFLGFRGVHDVMAAHGDGGKPIWMTEFGWNTNTATCDSGRWAGTKPAGVSEANQARYLAQAAHCLSQYPYVTVALWFTLIDTGGASATGHYGLMRSDGSHKPAYAAFQDAARGLDPFSGQGCGDFDGPEVAVKEPIDGGKFIGPLPFDVLAADPQGVARITLFADGRKIRNFNSAAAAKSLRAQLVWQGAKRLRLGDHTIRVVARDARGNETVQVVHVRRVDPAQLDQIATTFLPLRLSGSGRIRTLRTAVRAAVSSSLVAFRARDKVRVDFQRRRGGTWRTAHRYTKSAKAPVRVSLRLEPGQWRVRATFGRRAPFRGSRTGFTYFTVA